MSLHPEQALFASQRPFPVIAACDHYAGTEARMRKALALQQERGGRFDVTLDMEDGAPTGHEADHAELIVSLLRERGDQRAGEVGVRVHDAESVWFQRDLETLLAGAAGRFDYLTIPKVRGARQLAGTITAVQRACAAHGLERELPLHVLLETHGALHDAYALAGLPWLRSLEFGIMDFISEHHGAIDADAMRSPLQFEHALLRRAKTTQVAAALAHGLVPTHGVTLAVRDSEQVSADAGRARHEFGYLRMWSIHPSQIEPILEAFAPSHVESARAEQVLLAGQRAGWGPIEIDGTLYDRASYRYWWQLLRRAERNGAALSDEARRAFFRAVD